MQKEVGFHWEVVGNHWESSGKYPWRRKNSHFCTGSDGGFGKAVGK